MAIDTPQSALACALFFGAIVYWFYRRRKKKRAALAETQRREEERLAYLTASPAPLPGYDATGEELNAYVARLLKERSQIRCLAEVMSLLRGVHHAVLGSDDKRAVKRHIEILKDSCDVIEKSKKIDTVESRLEVMHTNLATLHNIYFIEKAKEADIFLKKLEPQIFTAVYCRMIQDVQEKIDSLKTDKAKERKISDILNHIQHIQFLNYIPQKEMMILKNYFEAYL